MRTAVSCAWSPFKSKALARTSLTVEGDDMDCASRTRAMAARR